MTMVPDIIWSDKNDQHCHIPIGLICRDKETDGQIGSTCTSSVTVVRIRHGLICQACYTYKEIQITDTGIFTNVQEAQNK